MSEGNKHGDKGRRSLWRDNQARAALVGSILLVKDRTGFFQLFRLLLLLVCIVVTLNEVKGL